MDRKLIIEKLKELDQYTKNFVQTYDLIVVLKQVDLNSLQGVLNGILLLPHETKYDLKICAFVSPIMAETAKKVVDRVITPTELEKYKNENEAKKLAKEYDIFIAQQEVMPQIARLFGKILGPRKKMPNPKTGGIFTQNSDLNTLVSNLKRTQLIQIKDQPQIQLSVGHEKMKPEEIAENINVALNHIISHLPGGKSNVKKVYIKKTMSPLIELSV
ncbi:MAG: 50S ribosomal protein L1 [Candidatus Woesearchaeota archaeon]